MHQLHHMRIVRRNKISQHLRRARRRHAERADIIFHRNRQARERPDRFAPGAAVIHQCCLFQQGIPIAQMQIRFNPQFLLIYLGKDRLHDFDAGNLALREHLRELPSRLAR